MVVAFFADRSRHNSQALKGWQERSSIHCVHRNRETQKKACNIRLNGCLGLLYKSWLFEHRDAYVHTYSLCMCLCTEDVICTNSKMEA